MRFMFTSLLLSPEWFKFHCLHWNSVKAIIVIVSFTREQLILLFSPSSFLPSSPSPNIFVLLKKHPSVVHIMCHSPGLSLCSLLFSLTLFYDSCVPCKPEVRTKMLIRFHSFFFSSISFFCISHVYTYGIISADLYNK